jgi:hypothetical protein
MPLRTDDILQARSAYDALEARALSAERRAAQLQALIAQLRKLPPPEVDVLALLRQRILDLEAENIGLRKQLDQLAQLKTDLMLQDFVAAMGLAAVIGEASMPDRSITSLAAKVQTYLAPADRGVGLRFQQPELGALAVGLSTTAFEVAKVPPAPGVPAPRSLYAVLQDKQHLLGEPFFSAFAPATQALVKIAEMFANTGAWRFEYLAQAAAGLAASERDLASLLAQKLGSDAVAANVSSVEALAALADSLTGKANPVAGDLLALGSALDLTTSSLRSLVP